MALITSDCGTICSLNTKWPWPPRVVRPPVTFVAAMNEVQITTVRRPANIQPPVASSRHFMILPHFMILRFSEPPHWLTRVVSS